MGTTNGVVRGGVLLKVKVEKAGVVTWQVTGWVVQVSRSTEADGEERRSPTAMKVSSSSHWPKISVE